jgi:hypothetical protein
VVLEWNKFGDSHLIPASCIVAHLPLFLFFFGGLVKTLAWIPWKGRGRQMPVKVEG